jgi:hypothetical protein
MAETCNLRCSEYPLEFRFPVACRQMVKACRPRSVDGIAVPAGDSTGGANNLSVQWNNMLPGSDKTVSFTVTNTGTANESIWLAFNDSNGQWTAINSLGTYGDAQIHSPLITQDFNNLNSHHPARNRYSGRRQPFERLRVRGPVAGRRSGLRRGALRRLRGGVLLPSARRHRNHPAHVRHLADPGPVPRQR